MRPKSKARHPSESRSEKETRSEKERCAANAITDTVSSVDGSCMQLTGLHVSDHPLVAHALGTVRDQTSDATAFRAAATIAALVLISDATRDLVTSPATVVTPLAPAPVERLAWPVLFAPILRAGLLFLDAGLTLIPSAEVGFVGLRRDETTLAADRYLAALPANLAERDVVVLEPMIATGGSLVAALDLLEELHADSVRVVSLLATSQGASRVLEAHPQTRLYVGGVDSELNESGFIVPGLGDAGDRAFGVIPGA